MSRPTLTALAAAILAGFAACNAPTDPCPDRLPIFREVSPAKVSLFRGVAVVRDNGTPEGCRSWASDNEELYRFRYLRDWGVEAPTR